MVLVSDIILGIWAVSVLGFGAFSVVTMIVLVEVSLFLSVLAGSDCLLHVFPR